MMLKNISWQLFIQPSEGAGIITKGININICFTVYIYMNLHHTQVPNNILPCIRKSCADIKVQPPSAI